MNTVLDLCCGAGGAAMGIDWMTTREMAQAVPPAYTEYIGGELRKVIR